MLNVISFLRCTRQRAPLIKYIVCTRSLSLSLCSYPLVFSRNQAKSRLGRRICICAAVFSFWCYSKYAFTYSRCDWRWWCPNARNVQPTSRCLHNFLLESIRYSPRTLTPSPHWQHEANNRGNCCILQPQAALQLSNSRLNDNNTHTHTHTSSYMTVTWFSCAPLTHPSRSVSRGVALLSSFGSGNFHWLLPFCRLIKCKLCQK